MLQGQSVTPIDMFLVALYTLIIFIKSPTSSMLNLFDTDFDF